MRVADSGADFYTCPITQTTLSVHDDLITVKGTIFSRYTMDFKFENFFLQQLINLLNRVLLLRIVFHPCYHYFRYVTIVVITIYV